MAVEPGIRFSEEDVKLRLTKQNAELREIVRAQGEFIQKMKTDIKEFLDHPSLGR